MKTLKVDDPFAVLDDIKQTPRYWRKAKYEMLAKLDNFGPFQFFFTLSCADLRWNENFAAILRKKGIIVRHSLRKTRMVTHAQPSTWTIRKTDNFKLKK